MDIQSSKIALVKTILAIDNIDFIQKVVDFIKNEKGDIWDELSVSQQKEIKKGIAELEEGKRASYASFLEKIS